MTILSQKYESTQTQLGFLQQDVDSLGKRLKLKNVIILELENKNTKKHSSEMLKLQDEVLSLKIHASRQDDSLIYHSSRDGIRSCNSKNNFQVNANIRDDVDKENRYVRDSTEKNI